MNNSLFKSKKIFKFLKDSEPSSYADFILNSINPLWSFRRSNARIVEIFPDTSDSTRFRLQPNYRWKFNYKAGQHIPLIANINGAYIQRYYSISSSPEFYAQHGQFDITVKRQSEGKMSRWLNSNLKVNDIIQIGEPNGDFILPESDEPLLFLAAGSGITPIYSMIESLYLQDRSKTDKASMTLLYYGRQESSMVLYHNLIKIIRNFPHLNFKYMPVNEGYISKDHLIAECPDFIDRRVYICGPNQFIESSKQILMENNLPSHQLMIERFSQAIPFQSGTFAAGTITLENSNIIIKNSENTNLLDIFEKNQLSPAYGCRQGICKTCQTCKKSGAVFNTRTQELLTEDNQMIELCTCIPVGDVCIDL